MSKETKNPYPVDDELRHQAWLHGFNSNSKDECPYEAGMLESDKAKPAWDRGFRAGQKDKDSSTTKTKEDNNTNPVGSLEQLDEQALVAELRKRRQKKYESLMKAKADIEKQLEELRTLF